MKTDEIVEFTKNWYSWSRSLVPELGTKKLAEFAGKSFGFSRFIPKISMKKLHIFKIRVAPDFPTAAVDLKTKTIYLPLWYFTAEGFEEVLKDVPLDDRKFIAVATINGSTIHELLHVALTHENDILHAESLFPEELQYVAKTAFNVFEDIYIEGQVVGYLETFIDCKNAVLFSRENLHKAAAEFDGKVSSALKVAVHWKRKDLRDDKAFEVLGEKAIALLNRVTRKEKKVTHAQALNFCQLFEIDPKSEQGTDSGDEFVEVPEKVLRAMKASEGASSKKVTASVEAFKKFAEKELDENSPVTRVKVDDTPGHSTIVPNVVYNDIMELPLSAGLYQTRKVDYSFMRMLKSMVTENIVPGVPKVRGRKIVNTRLQRIITDGKIFANGQERRDKGDIHVSILLDFSGSTSWGMSSGQPLFVEEGSAAKSIFYALRQANIPVRVYAHSSISRDTPWLIRIAEYGGKPTSNCETRFDRMFGIGMRENFDGLIIEEVLAKNKNRKGRHILIVLSDGEPCGNGYHGYIARNHTVAVIRNGRKEGNVIFSISLVPGVYDANDRIYGKEWNIKAEDNIEVQLQKLIERII